MIPIRRGFSVLARQDRPAHLAASASPASENRRASCDATALASPKFQVLDAVPEFGGVMKQRLPREAMPLSVLIALVLMALAAVIYLTGAEVLDAIMAFSR